MKKQNIIFIAYALLVLFVTMFEAHYGFLLSLFGLLAMGVIYVRSKDKEAKKEKLWALVAISILTAVLIVINIRFFSGEDDWICDNGQWAMHGHPSAPMPAKPCK